MLNQVNKSITIRTYDQNYHLTFHILLPANICSYQNVQTDYRQYSIFKLCLLSSKSKCKAVFSFPCLMSIQSFDIFNKITDYIFMIVRIAIQIRLTNLNI